MFLAGSARNAFDLLYKLGLLEHLFPDLAKVIHEAPDSTGVHVLRIGLQGTDERVSAEKSVTPTFLFAVLLWPAIQQAYAKEPPAQGAEVQHLLEICERVTARQQARVAVPKRFTLPLREIVGLQPRFERREGRRALRLLDHPRFRAAYDFLLLRAAAGEVAPELAEWWTQIQTQSAEQRIAQVEQLAGGARAPTAAGTRRRRGRRRRAPPA
jgi:poly(A) polymerase